MIGGLAGEGKKLITRGVEPWKSLDMSRPSCPQTCGRPPFLLLQWGGLTDRKRKWQLEQPTAQARQEHFLHTRGSESQGWGSAFIFCGSRSSIFSHCGSGSRWFLNATLWRVFFRWNKNESLLKSKKQWSENLLWINLQLITISWHFFSF